MSDSLNLLAKTVGRIEGGGALKLRYADWLHPENIPEEKEPEQEAKDILEKFMRDLGGK